MELCTAAARAPEFSWVRRNFFRDRRALNFATRRGSNFFDTFHFKTSFPNQYNNLLLYDNFIQICRAPPKLYIMVRWNRLNFVTKGKLS